MTTHIHPTGQRTRATAPSRPALLRAIVGVVNVLVAIFFLGGVFEIVTLAFALFRGTETVSSGMLRALLGVAHMAGSWFVFGWVNRAAGNNPDLGSEAR